MEKDLEKLRIEVNNLKRQFSFFIEDYFLMPLTKIIYKLGLAKCPHNAQEGDGVTPITRCLDCGKYIDNSNG